MAYKLIGGTDVLVYPPGEKGKEYRPNDGQSVPLSKVEMESLRAAGMRFEETEPAAGQLAPAIVLGSQAVQHIAIGNDGSAMFPERHGLQDAPAPVVVVPTPVAALGGATAVEQVAVAAKADK